MSLADAFAPVEALNREIVLHNTFGHLAPVPGKKYSGTILVAQSEYGDNMIFSADFGDLPDSPWLYDDMNDFIESAPNERPAIFKWSGWYVRYKNGNHRFGGGKFRKLKLPD